LGGVSQDAGMKMIVFMIWDLLFSNLRFIPRESTQPVVPEQHQEAGLQEMEHIFLFHVYIYIFHVTFFLFLQWYFGRT